MALASRTPVPGTTTLDPKAADCVYVHDDRVPCGVDDGEVRRLRRLVARRDRAPTTIADDGVAWSRSIGGRARLQVLAAEQSGEERLAAIGLERLRIGADQAPLRVRAARGLDEEVQAEAGVDRHLPGALPLQGEHDLGEGDAAHRRAAASSRR